MIQKKKDLKVELFHSEKSSIEKLEVERDEITRSYEELLEEHSGEDGLLNEVIEDGKIKSADLKARIKQLKKDKSSEDELSVLQQYEKLLNKESDLNKKIKEENEKLYKKVRDKYTKLSIEEVKKFAVDLKWNKNILEGINSIYKSVSHNLSNRIIELAERYESTLIECNNAVEEYEKKVKSHLERMGFVW